MVDFPNLLAPNRRVAILLHGGLQGTAGKTGLSLIRYSEANIVVLIDEESGGRSLEELTGISHNIPIVANISEALNYEPEVLAIGIAPSGGALPEPWVNEIQQAVEVGLSVVNGLHTPLAPQFQSFLKLGQMIWDIRQEPKHLTIGRAKARELANTRVLTVGTDMSIGKMSTSLELHRASQQRGLKSHFIGTGQAGIMIAGKGVPLDAVRVDFAAGAIEQQVLTYGTEADILHIEGQGSLLHPSSTATLPLIRGSQPTGLILVHRWGQTQIRHAPQVAIPPLPDVIDLYERVASVAGATEPIRVKAIALNTHKFSKEEADRAIAEIQNLTGLPCTDPIRYSADYLLDALLNPNSTSG
ncbi:MAG: DUF1611 domain-containing protein [Roseofilum sp. SBFL]|nr:DUF1611 domain-containing protein [Roseofilum sp. SID3]MBP0025967.1 DUF1611 domain-containing protein [Roseofilum sp. SID2]MBP0036139.1 DUF1611 domain-containing protein [Roseofilum sp. SID1]MBP0040507.1 DUF1611 domain-containing protein [Roseofilum sp. SBFL]